MLFPLQPLDQMGFVHAQMPGGEDVLFRANRLNECAVLLTRVN